MQVLRKCHWGAVGRPVFPFWVFLTVVTLTIDPGPGLAIDDPVRSDQIEEVRSKIQGLEGKLGGLERQSASTRVERERLVVKLDLAQARVEELELVLTESRNQIVALKEDVAGLATELEARKEMLERGRNDHSQ